MPRFALLAAIVLLGALSGALDVSGSLDLKLLDPSSGCCARSSAAT